jgi:glycosyltransferase involved in cell wall biosynthesis
MHSSPLRSITLLRQPLRRRFALPLAWFRVTYRRMPSVLHLLSATINEQTTQIHRMLTQGLGADFISTTRRIGSVAGLHRGELRNLPAAILQLRNERANITYAWGIPALVTAVLCGHPRILFSPDTFAGPRALRWIRALMSRADVTFISPTFTQRRLAVQRGIPPERCHVIQPGVDFGRVSRRRDPALRKQLGFTEEDYIMIAPGETTLASGHDMAVWSCGILNVLDPRYKMLLWGRGSRADLTANLANRLKQGNMIRQAEKMLNRQLDFEALLTIADVCVASPAGAAPTLPVATTMAAGVPIISTVTYMLAELLEDRHTALMVPNRSPRALVQRILDLREDPRLRAKLIDTARAEAYEHHSMTRMLDAYRRVLGGA